MKRFFLLFFLCAGAMQPQTPPAGAEFNLPAQKVGLDDLIAVSVSNLPELTRNFRVSGDGTLPVPLIHEKLRVAGMYPAQIEQAIAAALVKEGVLVSPTVSVSVAEYRSRPVSVVGAVRHPITFQAMGETTLLDAITRAEGLGPEAGAEILISRPHVGGAAEASALVMRVPVKGLIDLADPTLNIKLFGGEEIRVPEAGRVYVVGNVKKPGAFPVQDGTGTSILKMLALSEGLMPYTNKQAYVYRREGAAGSRSEIPVQLSQIIDRKQPDFALQPNDVLYIPDNKGRKMTMGTLERLAGFGTATASGMLIFHGR